MGRQLTKCGFYFHTCMIKLHSKLLFLSPWICDVLALMEKSSKKDLDIVIKLPDVWDFY